MTNGEKIKEIFPNAEISIIKSKSIYERTKVAVDWKFEHLGVDAISRQALLNATVKKSSIRRKQNDLRKHERT